MVGWALIIVGIAAAGSQIPTVHPNLALLGLGLLVAFAGGLLVTDRGTRR